MIKTWTVGFLVSGVVFSVLLCFLFLVGVEVGLLLDTDLQG